MPPFTTLVRSSLSALLAFLALCTTPARAAAQSQELRIQASQASVPMGAAYGRLEDYILLNQSAGVRYFFANGSGLSLEFERGSNVFGSWGDDDDRYSPYPFMRTIHVGYARRLCIPRGRRTTLCMTPHAELLVGIIENHDLRAVGGPRRPVVVGIRAALDFDYHVSRFFFGVSMSLSLVGGRDGVGGRVDGSLLPIARFGFTFGHDAVINRGSEPYDLSSIR